MPILSVDPGVVNTGLAILSKDKITKTSTYVCKEKDIAKKLHLFSNYLTEYCNGHNIQVLVYESPYFVNRGNNSVIMERMLGVLFYTIYNINPDIIVKGYSAKEIKKEITGDGESDKYKIQDVLFKVYGDYKFDSHHSSDAVAIGLTYFFKDILCRNLL